MKVNFKYDSSCEKEIFNKYYENPSSVSIMNKFVDSIENDSSLTYLNVFNYRETLIKDLSSNGELELILSLKMNFHGKSSWFTDLFFNQRYCSYYSDNSHFKYLFLLGFFTISILISIIIYVKRMNPDSLEFKN